jgi:membrane protease YdiL (CAAX protease family)
VAATRHLRYINRSHPFSSHQRRCSAAARARRVGIPHSLLTGLGYSFAVYRFRSTWMSIVLHSAQSVYSAILVLKVMLGLA